MKISYNWLKEYIDFDIPPAELGDILTMIGLEVEGIENFETVRGGMEGCIIAEVKSCEKHPNADKLYIITIDLGGETKEIIAGIKDSYREKELIGKKIIVLNNLEPVKIRGVESSAMLLAAKDNKGLSIVVPEKDIAVGSPIS